MKQQALFGSVLVVLVLGVLSRPARAQTVDTFTSLADWQAVVAGNWQFSQNFQGFTQDAYFQTAALNCGQFSLQQTGVDPTGLFQNFIDVPPLQFDDNSGGVNAAMYTKSGVVSDDMIFNAPVFAWGANFNGAQTGELVNLVITGSGGTVIATVPVTVNTGFFGFVISPSTNVSKVTFTSQITNPDASVGQGFGLENVTGAYVFAPAPVPVAQIATTASGLAFSRVSQSFSGTVTIKNATGNSLAGPFQSVFASLPVGVTLVNASGTFNGNPYITINAASLASGQSSTVGVQFSDPANAAIQASVANFSGDFNQPPQTTPTHVAFGRTGF